jgi:hypothetical protein
MLFSLKKSDIANGNAGHRRESRCDAEMLRIYSLIDKMP